MLPFYANIPSKYEIYNMRNGGENMLHQKERDFYRMRSGKKSTSTSDLEKRQTNQPHQLIQDASAPIKKMLMFRKHSINQCRC